MPELQIGTDKVCYVIVKAREFDVQEEAVEEDYGGNMTDEGFREVLASHAGDGIVQEVKDFIDGLNEDEKTDLVALAWLGRGDYSIEEWSDAVSEARSRHTGPTSDYLLGIPVLGDYLEEGLAAFGLSCADIEISHL